MIKPITLSCSFCGQGEFAGGYDNDPASPEYGQQITWFWHDRCYQAERIILWVKPDKPGQHPLWRKEITEANLIELQLESWIREHKI